MSAPRSNRTRTTRKFLSNTDPERLRAYLALNLLAGAAAADADTEQRERLKELPELLRKGAELKKIGAFVFEVMGPDWQPGPDWVAQIEAL